jgi:hypothetical protein
MILNHRRHQPVRFLKIQIHAINQQKSPPVLQRASLLFCFEEVRQAPAAGGKPNGDDGAWQRRLVS